MSASVDAPYPFPVPHYMYPFSPPPQIVATPSPRPKRRQVKNACTNCQKACKKCDDARPCLRCVKYGVGEECVDSQRKQRKKGIKRGPYKKRDGRGRAVRALDSPGPLNAHVSPASLTPAANPPGYLPVPLPPGYYAQYTHIPKPGEAPAYPYYIAQVAQPSAIPAGQEGEAANAQPQPSYYPIFHAPFPTQPGYPHSQSFITPFNNKLR
ncbi:hypothetical protein D9756_001786 [Leucocoprinus leucothites]|uniref:Transcription activator of gluconeogenesis ERT1 n=1 Tax=Leucocoprinus leucothites TaxID=201217 RepID=A0A8H5LHZ9_9AGAR|nr:hypothetical protein D9756_001786 [Leucoagaricus leucothites]